VKSPSTLATIAEPPKPTSISKRSAGKVAAIGTSAAAPPQREEADRPIRAEAREEDPDDEGDDGEAQDGERSLPRRVQERVDVGRWRGELTEREGREVTRQLPQELPGCPERIEVDARSARAVPQAPVKRLPRPRDPRVWHE
jgi:hypothetical protein